VVQAFGGEFDHLVECHDALRRFPKGRAGFARYHFLSLDHRVFAVHDKCDIAQSSSRL